MPTSKSNSITEQIEALRGEYRQGAKFSKFFLDDAAEDQANLFDIWQQKYVDALADQEALQREMAEKKAQLDGRVRKLAAEGEADLLQREFGLHKITEGAITSSIEIHKEVKEIQKRLADNRYLANTLRGIVEACQQRKSMVKELCQLAIMNYFGDIDHIRFQRSGKSREVEKEIAKQTKVPTGTRCSVCGKPQFMTSSGPVCEEGHGGAGSVEEKGDVKSKPYRPASGRSEVSQEAERPQRRRRPTRKE